MPGSLSGTFQGPGEAAALLLGGSAVPLAWQQRAAWPPARSSSLSSRPRVASLSWRPADPLPLPREAPFKLTLENWSHGQAERGGCRPFLSQQGEQASLGLSLLSVGLPRAALEGKGQGCLSPGPQSNSAEPCGEPCLLVVHFCWVDLPPVAPRTEPWSFSCRALSAMHTVASRGSR